MKILLTASYLIDTDKYNFWDKNSGYLTPEINESLKRRFPQKMKVSSKVFAQRYKLAHRPIDYENANLVICPICKRLLTDRKMPNPIEELDNVTELGGTQMCKSCAWELEMDVNIYGIEQVLERFKDDN